VLVPAVVVALAHVSAQSHPDLQGLWTNGTLTPLTRPAEFRDKPFLTPTEAAEYEANALPRLLKAIPPEHVATNGDLNEVYLDTLGLKLAEGDRTSLIVDPVDGLLPPQLPAAKERNAKRRPANYDDPEGLDLDERCLMETAFGSSNAAPPMVPNPFGQNFYQIVQTADYVMIYTEVVHDARIVRIGGTHVPASVRSWLGDSIAHWEGDTLVVDTTNFTGKTRFRGSSERLHVVERFERTDKNTIDYRVTVEDPDTWAVPWTAAIPFKATTQPILEYACHEGNYSMENSLRGHRFEERQQKF